MRHHYSVTAEGLPDVGEEHFHTFQEAQARFESLTERAKEGGRQVVEESYWRRELAGNGSGRIKVALDDIGLVPCVASCEDRA